MVRYNFSWWHLSISFEKKIPCTLRCCWIEKITWVILGSTFNILGQSRRMKLWENDVLQSMFPYSRPNECTSWKLKISRNPKFLCRNFFWALLQTRSTAPIINTIPTSQFKNDFNFWKILCRYTSSAIVEKR